MIKPKRENTLVIFAVKLNDEDPEVRLYSLEDKIKQEDEGSVIY